jgi:N-acetylmuramoyl-L-alanine amidase
LGVALVTTAAVLAWPSPTQHRPVARIGRTGSTPSALALAAPTAVPLEPGAFPAGACVAFEPVTRPAKATVFLDAGHGGPDPGAAGTLPSGQTVYEKDLTLPVVLAAAKLLRDNGYRVVLSRTVDTSVAVLGPGDLDHQEFSTQGKHDDLVARVRCADASGAAALVSVHFDAYPSGSARGASTLYDAARPFAAQNQALAAQVQTEVLGALDAAGWSVPDRGIAPDTTVGGGEITPQGQAYGHLDLLGPPDPGYVDQPSTMPGALTEPLFLTNATEAAVAADPAGQQAIAAGISQAVQQFLRAS